MSARESVVAEVGMTLIAAERQRQIDVEGYTPEHDAAHGGFVLSQAAHCYEAWGWVGRLGGLPDQWPWSREAWKPRDPISDIIRAGALFLAAHEQGYPTGWTSAQRCATDIDKAAAVLASLDSAHQPTPPSRGLVTVERACEVMHDAYEAAAVGAGWETQQASRKPWAEVPEANKATMRAAVAALLDHLAPTPPVQAEAVAAVERVRDVLGDHWDWKAGRSLHAAVTRALDPLTTARAIADTAAAAAGSAETAARIEGRGD